MLPARPRHMMKEFACFKHRKSRTCLSRTWNKPKVPDFQPFKWSSQCLRNLVAHQECTVWIIFCFFKNFRHETCNKRSLFLMKFSLERDMVSFHFFSKVKRWHSPAHHEKNLDSRPYSVWIQSDTMKNSVITGKTWNLTHFGHFTFPIRYEN